MSTALAIAGVTAALRELIDDGLNNTPLDAVGQVAVTTKPLDKARDPTTDLHQLNLFLYQTATNAAFRNEGMPGVGRRGEDTPAVLPLTLSYLITAYGKGDEDRFGHRILGRTMSVLHDHPLFGREEFSNVLAASDLHLQPERVRITPLFLSVEEMSKLWTTFQTQYRISTAYQVSVVLIESRRPTRTPLPVLTRGENDRGPVAQTGTTPPFPTLETLTLPNDQFGARLGDDVVLNGHHLDGTDVHVYLRNLNPLLADRTRIPPANVTARSATSIAFSLPAAPDFFPAGMATVEVVVIGQPGQPDRTTNALALPIAPVIGGLPANGLPVPLGPGNSLDFQLDCTPTLRRDQRTTLLFGDRELAPTSQSTLTTLDFQFTAPEDSAGQQFWIRLRVDGVDSLLVDRSGDTPRFEPSQKVIVT